MKRDMTPGEWQIDPLSGKRFRMVGGIKEYEMMVTTTYGVIPESQLEERMKHVRKASQRDEIKYTTQKEDKKLCPFRELRECKPECALHNNNGSCNYGKNVGKIGKFCPFSGQNCDERCQLHTDYGCKI